MVKKPIPEINYRARQNRKKKRNKLGETERIQKIIISVGMLQQK
jgi:hypothetical protein